MDRPTKKILTIFDLDNTILTETTDYVVLNLLNKSKRDEIDENWRNWSKYMQKAFILLKEDSVELIQIKSAVEKIPLNEGFNEIFNLIRNNKDTFETLIISGANTLYIKWIVDFHNLNDVVDFYFANHAQPCDELLIKIEPYLTHECENCTSTLDLCKTRVLHDYFRKKNIEDFESHYEKIIYVGDGDNDYCPSLLLNDQHWLFPRTNYSLFNMIYKEKYLTKLRCDIFPWSSGKNILEILYKIVRK